MEEYKVMDYQRYEEYLTENMLEMGKYDSMDLALEKAIMFKENPNKYGIEKLDSVEIIQMVAEDPLSELGGKNIYDDGWIVLIHFPKNDTDDTSDTELTDATESVSDKQTLNSKMSHSEQRNNDNYSINIDDGSFPTKKGRGKHPNSQKNLKPFKKGQSGNPSGKPTKFANLKGALDRWSDDTSVADFLGEPPSHATTMKERVHWRIWYKATQGDTKCIEILAQIGCLDD